MSGEENQQSVTSVLRIRPTWVGTHLALDGYRSTSSSATHRCSSVR
jgi:hypothetical protein